MAHLKGVNLEMPIFRVSVRNGPEAEAEKAA
jgi:hypothetical protein